MRYDEQLGATLRDLDVTFRFFHVAETYKYNKAERVIEALEPEELKKTPERLPGVRCEFFDGATGESFVVGSGYNEQAAFDDAVERCKTTPRPLTKGQKAMAQQINEITKAKDDEIAELKRRLAELSSAQDTSNVNRNKKI